MANKRICIQIDFDGPSPLIPNASTFDKRTSMTNIARLLRGIDHGSQYRRSSPSTVVVQQSLVQATGTVTAAAVQAADTASVGGTAMTATQLRASGTITAASAQAGDTVTVNGVVFTAVSGTPVGNQFDISGSDTAAAASLAAAVLAATDPTIAGLIEAKSAAAVCTIYAKNFGTTGNGYTLASSNNTRLAKSGATLANGASPANNQFDYIGTDNETAADLARCANASTSANITQTSASVASAVVTFTAKTPGVAGNSIALATSNNTRLAKSGTTLAGGSAGAPTQWTF